MLQVLNVRTITLSYFLLCLTLSLCTENPSLLRLSSLPSERTLAPIAHLEEFSLENTNKRILIDIFPDGCFSKKMQRVEEKFGIFRDLTTILCNSFLPIGYPASVPAEYLSFLRGVMSTQAILEGMGVGRADITALQATVQWIIRDGASMLGSLLFTSLSSMQFGQNVKSWRYFADFINNVGITLEMVAPVSRSSFLVLICLASVCKALCGVAAGASGAAINEHWGSKRGNIADVLAKNSAQHTLVGLVGLMFSIPFAKYANASRRRAWLIYGLLTFIHMFTNYQAMKCLALRSINESRLRILVDRFFLIPEIKSFFDTRLNNFYSRASSNSYGLQVRNKTHELSPSAVSKYDRIISPILPRGLKSCFRNDPIVIRFAAPLSSSLSQLSVYDIQNALRVFDAVPYVVLLSAQKHVLTVSFKEGVLLKDGINGMLTAHILKRVVESSNSARIDPSGINTDDMYKFSITTTDILNKVLNDMLEYNDWDLQRNCLFPSGMRIFISKKAC